MYQQPNFDLLVVQFALKTTPEIDYFCKHFLKKGKTYGRSQIST